MKQQKRGSRERRPQTLDLTATEIVSDPVKPEPVETAAETPAEPVEAVTASATPESEREPAPVSAVEPPMPEKPKTPDWLNVASTSEKPGIGGKPTGRLNWENIAASALGAAVMLGVFLAIYAAGTFSPASDQSAALGAQVAGLDKQMREIANRPLSIAPPDSSRDLADLTARIAKIESAASAPRPAQTDPATLAEIKTQLDAATGTARDAKSRADAAYEASQKSAQAVAAPPSNEKELTDLAGRVAAIEQVTKGVDERIARAAASAGTDRAVRLAFVSGVLRAAVERGDPFAQEFAALRPLVADAKVLAPLEPFAAGGVPRATQLSRELSGLNGALLSATGATPREGGFMERLQQNAERLVRIRPISETPGDEPATIISRADVKATNGNLAGAIAEIASLPPAVRAPADAWIKRAEAQQAALAAARSIAESAVAALAKP